MPPFAQRPERLAKQKALAPSRGSVARALVHRGTNRPKPKPSERKASNATLSKRDCRKRPQRPKPEVIKAQLEYAELVGPITESRRAHERRHSGTAAAESTCPRCRWYARGTQWLSHKAPITEPALRQKFGKSWLVEKPREYGGCWSIGCSICHAATVLQTSKPVVEDGSARPGQRRSPAEMRKRRFCTKWAMFGAQAFELQASHIDTHAKSDAHKRARRSLMQGTLPASNSAAVCGPDESSDDEEKDLLCGAVPQPADWLYAYENIQQFTSWRSSELKARPHNGIMRGNLSSKRHISRKQLVSMIRVWAIITRKHKLEWIRRCTSVCLGMDAKGPFEMMRFRCNAELYFTPSNFAGSHCTDTGCRMGILAGFNGLRGVDFDDDYGVRTAERAIDAVKKVFKSVYGDSSAEFNSFCEKVLGIVSDQALQKTCRILKERYFPNCILIHRDPTHAVRIALKDPMVRADEIEGIFHVLFEGDHALLKDLRFSDLWAERLRDCQRRVLHQDGALGGDLVHFIETFSFAAHRFESFCRPLFQVICLLVPIVLMLTMIEEDWRDASAQRRARKVLTAMNVRFILNMGLSADYAELALRLIRAFDVLAKDPATSRVLIETWKRKAQQLFVAGNIVSMPEAAVGKTATQIALEQLNSIGANVACGDRTINFLNESPTQVLAEGVRAFKDISEIATERLDADFSPNDLYMAFCVFHLSEWTLLLQSLPESIAADMSLPAMRMRTNWRHIWDAVGIGQRTVDDWVLAVLVAIRHRDRLTETRPQRNPSDVDPI